MTLRIVTDSTCDLPQAVITEHKITVVPLYINIGSQSYLDGVELSRREFYQQLPGYNPLPTTAAPGAESFRRVYETLTAQGATEILSIHVSRTLSATLDNARLGGEYAQGATVTVFDSEQISLGVGFLAIAAAKAAGAGRTVEEIVTMLEAQVTRTQLIGILDTLEFLRRSGRASAAVARVSSLLQIKPVFNLSNGIVTSERVRTRKRAVKRLVERLENLAPFEQVALIHSDAPAYIEDLNRQIQHLLPQSELFKMEITPILGAHLGPQGIGVVCVTTK